MSNNNNNDMFDKAPPSTPVKDRKGEENNTTSWFSKTKLWSSAQSYLGKITAVVQEETQGLTMERIKKDLEEFSQQLYSEVQGVQNAITKEAQKQKESHRAVTPEIILPLKNNNQASSSQVKSADNEHTSSWSYCIPTPRYDLVDPFLSNYRIRALELQKNPSLFMNISNVTQDELEPFVDRVGDKDWESLQVLPTLKEAYEQNVPDKMDASQFWSRYFFQLDLIAKEEMNKQSLLSSNIQNISTEQVLSEDYWSSENEEEAPLPDSLHMEWEQEEGDEQEET